MENLKLKLAQTVCPRQVDLQNSLLGTKRNLLSSIAFFFLSQWRFSANYLFCNWQKAKIDDGNEKNKSKFSQILLQNKSLLDRLKFVNYMKNSYAEHIQGCQEQSNVRTLV